MKKFYPEVKQYIETILKSDTKIVIADNTKDFLIGYLYACFIFGIVNSFQYMELKKYIDNYEKTN